MKKRKEGRRFMGVAESLRDNMPALRLQLKQAESELTATEAIAKAISNALWMFVVYALACFVLFYQLKIDFVGSALFAIMIAGLMFFLTYNAGLTKYKSIVKRRSKDVDKNLLYALQTMQIYVSSGMPIFDSIREIAKGKYGAVSAEFRIAVKNVESGSSLENELEEAALRNTSQNFRNAVWQIVNSIKSGADLNKNLEAIVDSVSKEELVEIRRYGSKLNPLVLMFMMLAVIIPSMGVTVLVIVSSMPGSASISETTFWLILIMVGAMQLMFIKTIRATRPSVSV